MKNSRRTSASAFTLVEIMIAMGIFMMVVLAIYSTWTAILRGSQTGLDAAATAQRSRVATHALEDSLTCATLFGANPRYYSFLADTDPSGEFSTLTFTSHLPMSFPGAGLYGDQATRRVSFYVEPDPVFRRRLVALQTPLMEMATDNPQGYPIVLARGVTTFLLEYWDARQGDFTTDPPPTNQLPAMVRFTLGISSVKDHSAPPKMTTRIVRILSASITPSMQAPLLPPTVPQPGAPGTFPGAPGGPGGAPGGVGPIPGSPGGPSASAGPSVPGLNPYQPPDQPFGPPLLNGLAFQRPSGPPPPLGFTAGPGQ
jgi:hypothetical protein